MSLPPSLKTVPPTTTMSPDDDLERLHGQSVIFTCVVEGIPTPTVTWYRNGGNPSGTTLDQLCHSHHLQPSSGGTLACFNALQRMWLAMFRARGPCKSEHQVRASHTHTNTNTCIHTHTHTHTHAHVYPLDEQCQYFLSLLLRDNGSVIILL